MLYEIVGGSRCGGLVDIPERPLGSKRFFLMNILHEYSMVENSVAMEVYIDEPMEIYLYCANNQLILIPNKQ